MIIARKAGLALAALFSAVLVAPVLADGASDFQLNVAKAQSTLDQISTLVDNIHNRVASGGGAGAQQVADTDETMKCPACGMTMTAKATDANTRAVTIKGKTYFCCAGCNMTKYVDKPANGALKTDSGVKKNNRRKKNP
jgi:hypothetical protein